MKDLGQFLISTGLRKQNYFIIDKIGNDKNKYLAKRRKL